MTLFHASAFPVRTFGVLAVLLAVAARPAVAQDGIPCPAEPTNMAIVYGDAVTCSFQPGDATDTFTFAGVSGEVIVVLSPLACVALAGPSGATVETCPTNLVSARLDAVLTETGTHTLITRPGGFVTQYSFALERLLPASPLARAMNYGETAADHINIAGDVDTFSFVGGVNDVVSIVVSTAATPSPCVELIAPNNTRSAACLQATSNRIQVILQQPGTYTTLVRQRDAQSFPGTWLYSVELQCLSGACNTAPLPPVGLTGVVSNFFTRLTWSAPTAGRPPTSYVVEAGTASGGTDVSAFDTQSTSTTFVAPGVPNGTYFVRVRSKNSVGTSGPSNEIAISGSTGCALPSAPGGFTASAAGLQVSLQWAAASGNPTSYVLEAGSSPGSANLASFDLGLATQFSTSAPPGTYFLRVRARNACGLGPASNEVTLVVGCSAPPGAPPAFTASASNRVVTLSWTAAAGQPSSYIVEVGSATGLSNLANFDAGNVLTLSGGAPPGTYFVRVRARNDCGTSGPSIERVVVVP
jgi:hypothetical protein